MLPPPLFSARCRACWFSLALLALVVASFWSLDLQWAQFFSLEAARSMGRFVAEFFPPDTSPDVLAQGGAGHLGDAGDVGPGHRCWRPSAGLAAGTAGQPAARGRCGLGPRPHPRRC